MVRALSFHTSTGSSIRLLLLRSDPQHPAELDPELWRTPTRALHPYIRWWWPGSAVTGEQLHTELRSIRDAGFAGVEIQTLTIGLSHRHLLNLQITGDFL